MNRDDKSVPPPPLPVHEPDRADDPEPLAEPESPAAEESEPRAVRRQPPMLAPSIIGWLGPLAVTVFAAILRFYRLSDPRSLVFDEVYYVTDGWSILKHGVEINKTKNAVTQLDHGVTTHILAGTQGELVAHPPLGKEMIAVGEWLFGLTPVGWRFSVAVIGSLSVLLLCRIVRRMTRSTLLGCIAGLLMALDGLELVLSRTAILDIFVMFWVLAAFGLLVIDRDRARERLGVIAAPGAAAGPASPRKSPLTGYGPRLGVPWLRIGAGLCLGAAVASKWNGVYFLAGFVLLVLFWDAGARRAAGYTSRWRAVWARSAPWLPLWALLVPAVVYVASWTGWFATPYGYDRNGAALNGGHPTGTLAAWLDYNRWMLQFGLGLTSGHNYRSNPVGWLVLSRPIAMYSVCANPCGRSSEQEVLAIGTPALWWGAAAALLICLVWWLVWRDWRAGSVLAAVAVGWLPWIWFYWHDNRTEFFYYAISFEPFLIIAVTLCLGLLIGPQRAGPVRRVAGAVGAGLYSFAVLINLAYLYPILTAQVIPYTAWLSRMWFRGWI